MPTIVGESGQGPSHRAPRFRSSRPRGAARAERADELGERRDGVRHVQGGDHLHSRPYEVVDDHGVWLDLSYSLHEGREYMKEVAPGGHYG